MKPKYFTLYNVIRNEWCVIYQLDDGQFRVYLDDVGNEGTTVEIVEAMNKWVPHGD